MIRCNRLGIILLLCSITVVALGISKGFCVPSGDNPSADYFGDDADFFRGKDFFLKNEFSQSRTYLEQYLKEGSQSRYTEDARLILALMETNIERAKDAFWQIYRDARDPALGKLAHLQFGYLLLLDGDYDEASDAFEQLALLGADSMQTDTLESRPYLTTPSSIAGFGPGGLYTLSLIMSDRIPAAENALVQLRDKVSSKTVQPKWDLLEALIFDKKGDTVQRDRILEAILRQQDDQPSVLAAIYYLLENTDQGSERDRYAALYRELKNRYAASPEAREIEKKAKPE